jgi:hypothetical protein
MIDLATDNFELDITRAHTILGWEPKRSVRDTLPQMIPSLKADPLAWYRENEIKPPLWLRELASSVDQTKEIEPHELMRLGKEVQHAIAMPKPKEMKMEKHDMSKMNDSNAMTMPKPKAKQKQNPK